MEDMMPDTKINEHCVTTDRQLYRYLIAFTLILFGTAFIFNSPLEIWQGNITIFTSPSNLVTDYFEIANIGAALVNAALMVAQAIIMIKLSKVRLNGLLVAAVLTVAGFSLFGKNLYNSTPIILGVLAYCRINKEPFRNFLPVALFGTALGPLVSEVSFDFGLPTAAGILLGVISGLLAGIVLPPLALHFVNFHKGFNLYNIGFTAGIVGTFFTAIFRGFGLEVDTVDLVSQGNNQPLAIFLYALFALIFLLGLGCNRWSLKDYGKLLRESGRGKADFIVKYHHGVAFINMALLGLLSTTYVLAVGGELNGPTIGGIFTVAGFGASGKHLRNVLPILTGVFLVSYFSVHDINSTTAVLAALFGTTLAPVGGYYGFIAGVVSGGIHIMLTTNVSFLHAGMNLYNNGFSGGFVAAVMVPILDKVFQKTNKNSSTPVE